MGSAQPQDRVLSRGELGSRPTEREPGRHPGIDGTVDRTDRLPQEPHVSDFEYSFYGQDHWVVTPRLALDLGVRTESQQVSGASRVAPRGGVAWSPFAHAGTLVQAGYGLFFDRVPLNVYCFNKYPDQNITMYGADGQVSSGPFLYLNTLGQVRVKHPFVFQRPQDGNFSPESAIWSLQIEQPLTPFLKLRAGYLQNYSQGLVILNSVAPDPDTNNGAYLLSGVGQSREQISRSEEH